MIKPKTFKPPRVAGSRVYDSRAKEKALYDNIWEKFSKDFLRLNDRCYSCGMKSEVTDHIEAHKGNETLFKKYDNFLPLCIKCHNTVTTLFDRGPLAKTGDKLKWLSRNRHRNDLTFKVKLIPYPS